MNVTVNGKPLDVADDATVRDLVEELGLGPRWVVVERNGVAVHRSDFADVRLAPGDTLEVVRPVQGGAHVDAAARRAALDRARLYLVSGALPGDVIEALLGCGVDLLQLREKEAEAMDVIEDGSPMQQACVAAGVPFIVNDRADVARALHADGVHLGQGDLPPEVARDLLGPEVLIGRSTHSEDDIRRALEEYETGWVDYIAVGPVHETPTKPGRPSVGYELVRFAAREVPFPWFAIGGIDHSNLPRLLDAGATRVVVVRAITEADDPLAAASALREALEGRQGT